MEWFVGVWRGKAGSVRHVKAGRGRVWFGSDWIGKAGKVRHGLFWYGELGLGEVRYQCEGTVRNKK